MLPQCASMAAALPFNELSTSALGYRTSNELRNSLGLPAPLPYSPGAPNPAATSSSTSTQSCQGSGLATRRGSPPGQIPAS